MARNTLILGYRLLSFKAIMKKNLLLLLIGFTLFSCSDSDDTLLKKLQAAVEAPPKNKAGYNVVQLDQLTDFEWDAMYYFGEEVNPKEMSDQLGFKWDGEAIPGGHDRLLFVYQNQVVNYIDYNTEEFPLEVFGCDKDRWVYPRSRSKFAAFKYCQGDKKTYAFIPEPCVGNILELKSSVCKEESKAK